MLLVSAIHSSAAENATIRFLSYNIHHGAGIDGKLDLKRIARVIRSASPDVVSLQEVDRKTGRTGGVDQAAELARLTNMNFSFGASMDFDGGKYGNAVLTRFDIIKTQVVSLPGEPRSALCVTLKTTAQAPSPGQFLFIATHLDTDKQPRMESVPLIEEFYRKSPKLPAVRSCGRAEAPA